MDYDTARSLIQTGDLIGLRETGGIVHDATRLFTRSPYTHNGVAIWLQEGLWMAEINGGRNHLIPMSQLQDVDFDVFECPVDRQLVNDKILDSMRVRVNYSEVAFVVAGVCDCFGLARPQWTAATQICSSFASRIYYECGWQPGAILMSPRDLCALLPLKLQVRALDDTGDPPAMLIPAATTAPPTNQPAQAGFFTTASTR